MNKILFLLLFIPLLICNPAFSQEKVTVKAKIISKEDGLPVIGATVLIKGTAIGTAARVDGSFDIQTKNSDVIEVSAIGFVSQQIKIKDIKPGMQIQLVPDIVSLKEVAVVGYGVQERRDLTGSVSSVNIRELDKTTVSLDNALAGKVPGVLVNSSSGQPGSATSIIIRGLSSLNKDANNPLIVIDGVPVYGSGSGFNSSDYSSTSVKAVSMDGGSVSGSMAADKTFEKNPLASINPEDIESIEILKDAFATAIYGSRGAAGVILITTKKGVKGTPRVDLSYSMSLSEPVGLPDLLNADEYRLIYGELGRLSSDNDLGHSTNWLNKVTRTALTQNTTASVSAGTEKSTYYISLSNLDQQSYIIENDFSRTSARMNFNYNARESVKFGVNTSVSFTDNNALNAAKVFSEAVIRRPIDPIYKENGSYHYNGSKLNDENPIQIACDDINFVKDTRVVSNLFAEIKPLSWLTFKTEVGLDLMSSESYSRLKSRLWLEGGSARQSNRTNKKYVVNNTLTAIKVLGDHSINAVVGQSFEKSRENNTTVSGREFNSDNEISISAAGKSQVENALVQQWAIFSAFTRINYQYLNKYMGGFTYRVDGSSRFNKSNRYIGFPSFSLGWRVSNEDFMEPYPFIDDLKFRGSIGFTGTDGSGGYYGNQGQYTKHGKSFNYNGVLIYELNKPNNPNLKWERTRSYDLGMDLSLLDSRIKLTVDYYYKKIENMITSFNIPTYKGFGNIQRNFGDMQNSGFEIDLYTENIKTDFMWTTSFNIARNTNKVLNLNIDGSVIEAGGNNSVYISGKAAPQFYLYQWLGVDPITGNPLWGYPDGSQQQIPPQDYYDDGEGRKACGTYLPEFYGGITNSFSYKGFELNAFFSFSYGGQMLNGTKAQLMTYTTKDMNNLHTDILDYWKISGHKTSVPALDNNSLVTTAISSTDYTAGLNTTRFLEDNSFLRLKTLTLSYNFSGGFLKKCKVRRLRLYAQGTNLLTLTKYSGIDPEVSAFGSTAVFGGYDLLTMPQNKTIQFGVNIGF